ncbi:MAG: hypothetical protein NC111_06045 [Bacteroides sp.]|nr:hypothetical protein [Bacteroides sp.]MCM1413189.1 hypothetical protein [Bacteroides sp.]MCM1472069.1 hypothetical protein [Bacteroides sp.]
MSLKQISKAFFLIAIAILSSTTAFAESPNSFKGQKSVGLRGGFTTRNTTASAGLYFSYRFTEHFRFAPKIDYAFRHKDVDAFSFNFDAEMPIALDAATNRVNFYPIAGLNYTTATSHAAKMVAQRAAVDTSDDSSQRYNRFGLNLGAGIEYFASPTLRLAFEAKCQLLKQMTGGWLIVSIGYVF